MASKAVGSNRAAETSDMALDWGCSVCGKCEPRRPMIALRSVMQNTSYFTHFRILGSLEVFVLDFDLTKLTPPCLQDGVGAHLLEQAYNLQKRRAEYKALLDSGAIIDGTYDDHDLGQNDAGKHLSFK